jgi:hypothetical protein
MAMGNLLTRARRSIARSPVLQIVVFIAVLLVVMLAGEYLGLIPA